MRRCVEALFHRMLYLASTCSDRHRIRFSFLVIAIDQETNSQHAAVYSAHLASNYAAYPPPPLPPPRSDSVAILRMKGEHLWLSMGGVWEDAECCRGRFEWEDE